MIVLANKLLALIFTTWYIIPIGYTVIKYFDNSEEFNNKLLLWFIPLLLRFTLDYRVGALCCDEWESFSTGSGTCSDHEGVCYWTYEIYTKKYDSEILDFLAGAHDQYNVGTWRTFLHQEYDDSRVRR
jgi:hypothetical protein